jgi:hypothetical protein
MLRAGRKALKSRVLNHRGTEAQRKNEKMLLFLKTKKLLLLCVSVPLW